jgi:hypothetical protein
MTVMMLNGSDSMVNVSVDLFNICFRVTDMNPVIACTPGHVSNLCRSQQSLAGYTTIMKTITTKQLFFFNQCHIQTQLSSDAGNHQAACTTADNRNIVFVHQSFRESVFPVSLECFSIKTVQQELYLYIEQ